MNELKPFKFRIDDFEVTNYHQEPITNIITMQYVHFIKWESNPYFGTEANYEKRGKKYYFIDGASNTSVHESCFKSIQNCYTIGSIADIGKDTMHFESCGDRPYTFKRKERKQLNSLIKLAFKHINKTKDVTVTN